MAEQNGASGIKVEAGNTRAFLALPKQLYPTRANPRSYSTESQLVSGTHTLCKYFDIHVFTASRDGRVQSRCALTLYPDDETAYLGFFDSKDDEEAVRALFTEAERLALSKGIRRIAGPVDASFWIGYRMKANLFGEAPYFGEPCGLPWYQRLWEMNGYAVCDWYCSNMYGVSSVYTNRKYSERLTAFLEKGYLIKSPKRSEWDRIIGEVYALIMLSFSDFPMFKYMSEDDFRKHYAGLRHIVDFSMVKMAYQNEKAVGFFISVPDYGHMLNQGTGFLTLARAYLRRIRPARYVMLYMGVDPEHRGLGKALSQTIIDELLKKQVPSIGALIHQGKVNERYVEDMIEGSYQYMLFEKYIVNNE